MCEYDTYSTTDGRDYYRLMENQMTLHDLVHNTISIWYGPILILHCIVRVCGITEFTGDRWMVDDDWMPITVDNVSDNYFRIKNEPDRQSLTELTT